MKGGRVCYIVTRSACVQHTVQPPCKRGRGSHTLVVGCRVSVASASHVNQTPLHINQPDVPVMSRCRYLCPSLMDLSLFVSAVISI